MILMNPKQLLINTKNHLISGEFVGGGEGVLKVTALKESLRREGDADNGVSEAAELLRDRVRMSDS